MATQLSILDLKKAFLATQIRILNTTLEPPPNWSSNTLANHAELDERIVNHVLYKRTQPHDRQFSWFEDATDAKRLSLESIVNNLLRRHNLAVYSSQATRNIVEMIYGMYWESEQVDLNVPGDGLRFPEKGANLLDDE